jgi:hypothetical protein
LLLERDMIAGFEHGIDFHFVGKAPFLFCIGSMALAYS